MQTAGVMWLMFLGLILGVGYTVPPLKFCCRGFGELVVGFTHSPYVLLTGFFMQMGTVKVLMPWLLSIPLFFAIMAAILLAALPDYTAYKSASKKTVVVIFGPMVASYISMFCVVIALVSVLLLISTGVLVGKGTLLFLVCFPHGMILLFNIAKTCKEKQFDCRIDNLLQISLSYIIWFGLIPLLILICQ